MKLSGQIQGLTKDIYNGKFLLTIAINGKIGEEINEYIGKDLNVEISPHKKKRSRNANNYMWELCSQIAAKIETPPVEIYRQAITELSILFQDFTFETEQNVITFTHLWGKQGIGWQTEPVDYTPDGDGYIIRAYYGSSTFNSAQMARLINWIEEEAKQLGISVESEREKSLLLEKWEAEKC